MRTGPAATDPALYSQNLRLARRASGLYRGLSLAVLGLMLSEPTSAWAQGTARPAAAAPRLPNPNVPIPPSRPMDLGETVEEEDVEEEGPAAEAPASTPATRPSVAPPAVAAQPVAPGALPPLCAGLVKDKAIIAERAPPVPVQDGCSLPVPVRLTGVRLADGNVATFSPPAVMRCEMVAAIADWVKQDLEPAAEALGSRIETVRVADSYACRPRNRRKGAQISEHGQGNAFDTYGFVLADGRALTVKGKQMPVEFQTAMKASACARFPTVLGYGSDGYHEDHIHVDLAQRRLDVRLCKWKIDAAPAVAARPPAAPAAEAQRGRPAQEEETEMVANVPLPPRRPSGLGPKG